MSDSEQTLVLITGALGVLLIVLSRTRTWRNRAQAMRRLEVSPNTSAVDPVEILEIEEGRPVFNRFRPLPFVIFVSLFVLLSVSDLHAAYCFSIALMLATLAWLVQDAAHQRAISRFENQLADVVDLIVAALRAGSSLADAMTNAAKEVREPLRSEIEDIVDRIRLGEDPNHALTQMQDRVPLESFRLFGFTLASHWGGGGSLAPTLSSVGLTIRDRITLSDRIRSQAMESQLSVYVVLVISYALGYLLYKGDPERAISFAHSGVGVIAISGSMVLQTIGLIWMFNMTKIDT
ncbi:MAG: type II secretion system F family protein [Planctomycetota bacterium]